MGRVALKHHPQLILLWVARNYLNESEFRFLLDGLIFKRKSDRIFLRKYLERFDIERIRKNSLVWQDIWIYNYLVYDCKEGNLPKTKLILQYEREIAMPEERHLQEFKMILEPRVESARPRELPREGKREYL